MKRLRIHLHNSLVEVTELPHALAFGSHRIEFAVIIVQQLLKETNKQNGAKLRSHQTGSLTPQLTQVVTDHDKRQCKHTEHQRVSPKGNDENRRCDKGQKDSYVEQVFG